MTTPHPQAAPAIAEPADPRRRWVAGFAALAGLGALGLAAGNAQAHGWGPRRGGMDGEEMTRRLEWRIGRLVKDVGGTPQQKDRLVAIATAALADLRPLREQRQASRQRGLALLAAPAIDRAALEQARLAQMQAADARSRRLLQAMADAAEVLTPEQRARAAERLKRRMGGRWRG